MNQTIFPGQGLVGNVSSGPFLTHPDELYDLIVKFKNEKYHIEPDSIKSIKNVGMTDIFNI